MTHVLIIFWSAVYPWFNRLNRLLTVLPARLFRICVRTAPVVLLSTEALRPSEIQLANENENEENIVEDMGEHRDDWDSGRV